MVHSSFLGFVGIFGRGSEDEEMEQVLLLSCVTDSFSEHVNLCDHIILLHFGMTLSLSLSLRVWYFVGGHLQAGRAHLQHIKTTKNPLKLIS